MTKKAVLFLKKKNQKNFWLFGSPVLRHPGYKGIKSFLLLFFKKEALNFA